MATRMLRRGLPRVSGGEPWPPADAAGVVEDAPIEAPDEAAPSTSSGTQVADVTQAAPASVAEPVGAPASETPSTSSGTRVPETSASGIRRGLPRVAGGDPWPPAGTGVVDSRSGRVASTLGADTPDVGPIAANGPTSGVSTPGVTDAAATGERLAAAPVAAASVAAAPVAEGTEGPVRRGLPRTVGGEPWPPEGTVPAVAARADAPSTSSGTQTGSGTQVEPTAPAAPAAPAASAASATDESTSALVPAAPARAAILAADLDSPLPWTRTVWNGRAPRQISAAPASARRLPTWPQAIAGLFAAAGLGVLAAAAVAFVRTLLSFPFMQDFLAAFPGEYEPAIAVAPGFAPWIGWQHFFNAFLMVLIIRSGLTIRNEKRPTAFWTPRNNPKGKVSLTIWFHQALDILWLVNGVIFIVLLFVTGHWLRIVPTSWEVIPNALSAALQYVSFDWPTEHGWVNYNSLQQLAYFVTVFIAAPLAAVTGFRMSGMWPKRAERLSKAYPIEWARALHFPVMLYFVVFIIGHVALVFLTGFLRNLNHMYASSDAATWTGFWVFVASLVVIAAGWAAARPLVIAPIAKLFGSVSSR